MVFPVGAATGNIQSVNITIADDDLVERSEDFLVEISSPDPDVLFDRDSASVTIADNDGKWSQYFFDSLPPPLRRGTCRFGVSLSMILFGN